MKRILTLTVAAAVILTLSACQLYTHDYTEDVTEYAMIATKGSDLSTLSQYPNLEYVDLRGSTCYEEILHYCTTHPDITVRFSIDLGQQPFNQDVTEIKIMGSDAGFEDMLNNLKYFRSLKTVHIDQISITKDQMDQLKAAYPQIDFTYTVMLGNESYDANMTKLNLSHLSSEDIELACSALGHLTNLTHIDLVDDSGKSDLSVADCSALMKAYPEISFNYQFALFGQTLSTETESLTYTDKKIGSDGLEKIKEALSILPNCTYICLDNCGIANEEMDQFRADLPEKTIVWRVFIDKYSVMTDTEVVLMKATVTDDEAKPLKYCTNVKYLDMSGCNIRDFSFLTSMQNLECVVLQQTHISDLSVLQNCQNLTWLDLAGCTSLKDLSPLSGMANLKYLNLSATKVKDLSPLNKVSLERFKCAKCIFTPAELRSFESKHPNCLTTDTGNMIGMGWRYNDASQREPFEYYVKMTEVFGYTK